MIVSALLGLLGGLLIGGRFRVFTLIPVLIAALALTSVLASIGAVPPGRAALGLSSFAVALQAGYTIMIALGAASRKPVPTRPLAP